MPPSQSLVSDRTSVPSAAGTATYTRSGDWEFCMHPTPGPWSVPVPVSPLTVVPIVSGRGAAQLSPPAIVVDVVDGLVVGVTWVVVEAGAVVVVAVEVVSGAQTDTPSRWHRLSTVRRQAEFMLAKTPQVVEH